MKQLPIYLDYMATTPVDPRVIEKMIYYLGPSGIYGNAGSTTHIYGKMALEGIEESRIKIANAINAFPSEIIFTSGATESNNLAILGSVDFYKRKGNHIITLQTEHKSVLNSCKELEKRGFKVTYIKPQQNGLLDLDVLKSSITNKTILVSIMHVNNEIGVIQDICSISDFLYNKGIIFHVDATQSMGKLKINLNKISLDLMSFSGHKIYGPKGIGVLYVRNYPKRIHLVPQSFGGKQENGLRSGTLATHQIVGIGEAFYLSELLRKKEQEYFLYLRKILWEKIKNLPGIQLNSNEKNCVNNILNISFRDIDGDILLSALNQLAISKMSTCLSETKESSYVLRALGIDDILASNSIRISFGRFTTEKDIKLASDIIYDQINKLFNHI
ncbi:aminotransferase class V-fold PLP-dependent enzyme [Candidatus Legionella polyplacis]|uniref:cysteine desulfurase n=1 Tax=Candidatus Legionella polyplacis TaxID=2005262 RepID=A0ABZ2GXF0_9GAMM